MRYFKYHWNEDRGDEYASWGGATYYFEVDDELNATRQIELYDNGTVLAYDLEYVQDENGSLTDQPLNKSELGSYAIAPTEFEAAWAQAMLNRKRAK